MPRGGRGGKGTPSAFPRDEFSALLVFRVLSSPLPAVGVGGLQNIFATSICWADVGVCGVELPLFLPGFANKLRRLRTASFREENEQVAANYSALT